MKAAIPNLNHAEIQALCQELDRALAGCFTDRVITPALPLFPMGYLKNHWAIRLNDPANKRSIWLEISARGTKPFLRMVPSAKKANASQSAFGLALEKQLTGAKLESIQAEPGERWVRIRFSNDLELVLVLIPAATETILLKSGQVIARSKTGLGNKPEMQSLQLPTGRNATQEFQVRAEFQTHAKIAQAIELALESEAFETRTQNLDRLIQIQLKKSQQLEKSQARLAQEIAQAPDWKDLGDLYQARMRELPKPKAGHITLEGWDSKPVKIPVDTALDPPKQLKALYQKARRIEQKKQEWKQNQEDLKLLDQSNSWQLERSKTLRSGDWTALEQLETKLGISYETETDAPGVSNHHQSWPGKRYRSIDGQWFWVGRNSTENLDLTFRHAKGNDLWMHLRGRASSHAIIPLTSGKTASLETLLDVAHAIIHHAGGKHWGKTEVDYTLKKFVKKIKGSTEASYSQNKTLVVAPDEVRMKRLLAP